MSEIKRYFREEFRPLMFGLKYPTPSDFYLSACQTNRSSAPLLVLRALLFITSISIVLTSMIIYIQKGIYRFWFIYLTHWGLTVMTVACAFAVIVSARCQFFGPISKRADGQLPWYLQAYWVLYNVAVPIAFLITVFYWTVLYEAGVEEELNHSLDVAVHGVNTLLMFLLVVTSSQPSRLLHVLHPIVFALAYFCFGLIYYLAGGVDPNNQPYVYSVVNWNHPGTTVAVGALTGVLLSFLYFLKTAIAITRDSVSRKCINPSPTPVEEGVPLRYPALTSV